MRSKFVARHILTSLLVWSLAIADEIATREKIEKFRAFIKPRIFPNSSKVHNFISDDLYVQRWLQDNDYNVELSTQKFLKHLSWRQRENIDTIDLEDWSFFQREYPLFINTFNKNEIPVVEQWLSEWNVRRAVLSGLTRKLIRWSVFTMEMTQRDFYRIRRDGNTNITSAVEIIDLEGFNPWQHGCSSCVPVYTTTSHLWETHYPGIWKSVYMINVGPAFRTFLNMGRSFQYDRQKVLRLYTTKNEWLPVLDREISRKQRSVRYGGYIDRSFRE